MHRIEWTAVRPWASTALSVTLAASIGLPSRVTAEPQQFELDSGLSSDTIVKVVPPLRSDLDVMEVVATGSGCPAGTWDAEVVDDGGDPHVLLALHSFEQATWRARWPATLDCNFSFKVRHEQPVSLTADVSQQYFRSDDVNALLSTIWNWNDMAPNRFEGPLGGSFRGGRGAIHDASRSVFTACSREHEFQMATSLSPVALSSGRRDGVIALMSQRVKIGKRPCPPTMPVDEVLAARVLNVSTSGSFGPSRSEHDQDGFLSMSDFSVKRGTAMRSPFVGRSTVQIDLLVPTGYQFRGPHVLWSAHTSGAGSAKMSATYSYGGVEAQRTDWEASANLGDTFISSRHEVDLWSPTCDQPGAPVRLVIDLDATLEGTATSPVELLLSGNGIFRNGTQWPGSSEWRRCSDPAPQMPAREDR